MTGHDLPMARVQGADPVVPLPTYASEGAAGMDVCANLNPPDREAGLTLAPGTRLAVPTGLAMAVPEGFEIQVRARSGLALKQGLMVANGPGTVDADYRGEVKVIVLNAGAEPIHIAHGVRIAQLVLAAVPRATPRLVTDLSETVRGAGGFGSTGV